MRIFWAVLALGLAGCNGVESVEPMFVADKTAERLKPGVWFVLSCPAGRADDNKCRNAGLVEVSPTEMRKVAQAAPSPVTAPIFRPVPYVIAGANPLVIQAHLAKPADTDGPAAALYVYFALEPTSHDAEGRIDGAMTWPILCGPPPKPGDPNYELQDEDSQVTNHPFPGLMMDDQRGCTPKDKSALFNAVGPSRNLVGQPLQVRWTRPAP